jgi:hypothetical protein
MILVGRELEIFHLTGWRRDGTEQVVIVSAIVTDTLNATRAVPPAPRAFASNASPTKCPPDRAAVDVELASDPSDGPTLRVEANDGIDLLPTQTAAPHADALAMQVLEHRRSVDAKPFG